TAEGKQLLAHELTHTLQQGGSSISSKRIQRKPAKDQKADNTDINYFEVIDINKYNWKEFGFNYINLFKNKVVTPYDTPNAYANEVFKLQGIILELIPENDRKKFPVYKNGILDLSTISWLADFGLEAERDP